MERVRSTSDRYNRGARVDRLCPGSAKIIVTPFNKKKPWFPAGNDWCILSAPPRTEHEEANWKNVCPILCDSQPASSHVKTAKMKKCCCWADRPRDRNLIMIVTFSGVVTLSVRVVVLVVQPPPFAPVHQRELYYTIISIINGLLYNTCCTGPGGVVRCRAVYSALGAYKRPAQIIAEDTGDRTVNNYHTATTAGPPPTTAVTKMLPHRHRGFWSSSSSPGQSRAAVTAEATSFHEFVPEHQKQRQRETPSRTPAIQPGVRPRTCCVPASQCAV